MVGGMFKSASLLVVLAATAGASVVAPRSADGARWKLEEHLGNLSPYFDAPVSHGLSQGVPAGCEVESVSLVHRHGSRGPISQEIGTIRNLSYYLNNHTSELHQPLRRPPARFAFLANQGWNADGLKQDDLTAVGRRELFEHGVQMRLDYPALNTTQFLAGEQDRVVESAQWFAAGYLGKTANTTAKLEVISESLGVKSYITPMETCKNWTYASGGAPVSEWGKVYLPPIAAQFNRELKSVWPWMNLTADNVHGMLWACAYDLAATGKLEASRWCGVFSREQIEQFEYELDLLMRGAFGYGLPNRSGQIMGSLFVSNLTERLTHPERYTEPNGAPKTLWFDFAHDTTIDLILTTLGLVADKSYPTTGPVSPARNWRTSLQVPFGAQMEWRKLSCGKAKSRIQLRLNKAPLDLSPICKVDRTGACLLDDFLNSAPVKKANQVQVGDEAWTAACGK